jgi:hypothetical protein
VNKTVQPGQLHHQRLKPGSRGRQQPVRLSFSLCPFILLYFFLQDHLQLHEQPAQQGPRRRYEVFFQKISIGLLLLLSLSDGGPGQPCNFCENSVDFSPFFYLSTLKQWVLPPELGMKETGRGKPMQGPLKVRIRYDGLYWTWLREDESTKYPGIGEHPSINFA